MKKIIDYLLSGIYLLYFGLVLVVFHLIQVICFNFFSGKTHQKSVHWLNGLLLHGLWLLGTRLSFKVKEVLPTDRPVIFIANHQSMFDIVGMIWYLRKSYPIFVSKIELAKGIPSISYNLRKSGAALIDRKDGKQAIMEIAGLGKLIEETKFSAVIFPEGTRSRTGQLKQFAVGGVGILLKKAPHALVVPIAVQNTGKLNPTGIFPLSSLEQLSWTVLPSIEPKGKTAEEVLELARTSIENTIKTGEV
ncbi:lysophospholipid acyltransferase family protein [Runella sp.]|jgi:1-acyl-sn-glycerol-3-phosphate acyltransferase|uniref:lysophospholipid acyltransferase family protein n=1 Tax=Runella sp. TaxID=1960881 RepID=UPI0030172D71